MLATWGVPGHIKIMQAFFLFMQLDQHFTHAGLIEVIIYQRNRVLRIPLLVTYLLVITNTLPFGPVPYSNFLRSFAPKHLCCLRIRHYLIVPIF